MDIGDILKALPAMDRDALCKQWQEHFNKPAAPDGVRKELLVRMLAYRVQEQAFGGLSARSRRRLDEMAAAISSNPKTAIANMASGKPGTQLIRSWKGKTHTVIVQDSGYQYDGRRYRSLSEIARHITGTQWSGPLFFGLKSRRTGKGTENAK